MFTYNAGSLLKTLPDQLPSPKQLKKKTKENTTTTKQNTPAWEWGRKLSAKKRNQIQNSIIDLYNYINKSTATGKMSHP